ncbi:MAG: glutaredoxin family protein [Cyanobacteria bacterium J06621_11]
MTTLILYSKPGCHLCEGLQEKLETLPLQIEVRDITQNEAWFQRYQYEVPVVCYSAQNAAGQPTEKALPRMSPRASAAQVAQMIQTHVGPFKA